MPRKAPATDPGDDRIDLGAPKTSAAGVPSVAHSLRQAVAQMGVRRSVRTLRLLNQADGFDCPGCAWPEEHPDHRKAAEFCENGAKAVAEEATLRRVEREFFARHSLSDLASRSGYWLGQQGRLTEPMLRRAGSDHYEPVSWEDAFALVAAELNGLDSPDEAAFYTSGRTSNEAAFVYQLFVRAFGTNNLPDCSNMCHESSGSALTETLGVGKGSVSLADLSKADLIIVVGQNPGTNHPRMLTALEHAKKAGAHLVAVNPLPEAGLIRFRNPQTPTGLLGGGTTLADQFLQIRLGGDLALFAELNRRLLAADRAAADRAATDRAAAGRAAGGTAADAVDREFVEAHTDGFDALAAHLDTLSQSDVAEATGLPAAEIDELFGRVLAADKIVVCWAMGLTQHRDSVPTIRELVNFLLLRGNIGRPGAGVCPVRGHSNVQGDRTMGICEKPSAAFLDALGAEFGFSPPRRRGLDTVETIRAMRDGVVKVFVGMGGNFVSATPDTAATEAAIRRLRLSVQVSTKLNRSHVVTGEQALILPTLGRTEVDVQAGGEQFVTVEDSMSAVHASRGTLAPASDALRSEVAIVCGLAQATLGAEPAAATARPTVASPTVASPTVGARPTVASPTIGARPTVEWAGLAGDYRRIRAHVAAVVPGFTDFEAKVSRPGGFVLPHPPRDSRTFPTLTGRARFTVNPLSVLRVPPGHLLLQTVRSHDQYNTTIYGLDDRYRGVRRGRRVVFVHPDDLAAAGFAEGDRVDLVSVWTDGSTRRAADFRAVAYPTALGCAAAYFPETNVLVPLDATAKISNTPTSKSLVVRLEARAA